MTNLIYGLQTTTAKPRKSRSVTPKKLKDVPMDVATNGDDDAEKDASNHVANGEEASNLASAVD